MSMHYRCLHVAVTDMKRSEKFYHEILGLKVIKREGENVILEGGIALMAEKAWGPYIRPEEIMKHHKAGELCFEEDNMRALITRLNTKRVEYVHQPLMQKWGQKVVRFYDPDGHMIEVEESLSSVVKRFKLQGMDEEHIADKIGIGLDDVYAFLSI